MHCKKLTMFDQQIIVGTLLKKPKIEKMPYFSIEKRYRKNSNRFELQEPRGTVHEFFTKIRDKNSFRRWWVIKSMRAQLCFEFHNFPMLLCL